MIKLKKLPGGVSFDVEIGLPRVTTGHGAAESAEL